MSQPALGIRSEAMTPLKVTVSAAVFPMVMAEELTSRVVPSAMVSVPEVKLSEVSDRRNWRESRRSRVSALAAEIERVDSSISIVVRQLAQVPTSLSRSR
ncbi:hypothetical protein A2890_01555 [candidate division WWE3 bacterium RIFCSPLOWO2_01_FULL_53_14]|uniref:Uncharacterized protein n=1 Tax=candidate division WWE3 bacterium RIFCSPLOWO2_01_FULL_53_14 TaxID=1802628 RepID=A0A1F4VS24_UNCKA|nr:MAG: hypothetical protein A2890_01555 [candidate division WWE3 bacterium RIFCSPLOWO2_01_FULL_53_14]